MSILQQVLPKLVDRSDLSAQEMADVMEEIMTGRASEAVTAAVLVALRMKGETADELVGAARTLRQHMRRIPVSGDRLVDTCGTGGDGLNTFNISTAAALVVAACGVPVAKHGNRGVSSRSGSADVLRQLGVCVELDVDRLAVCLERTGIAFCFAPLLHPSMKHVQPVRRELGIRTIFNALGPLANPAGAAYQLLGVSDARLQPLLARALAQLGTRRAWVVRGEEGLDEISIERGTRVFEVEANQLRERVLHPEDFGLIAAPLSALRVNSVAESAAVIEAVLSGQKGAARDIVLANAAAALFIAGQVPTLQEGVAQAADAIDAGRALAKLEELARVSQELAT